MRHEPDSFIDFAESDWDMIVAYIYVFNFIYTAC